MAAALKRADCRGFVGSTGSGKGVGVTGDLRELDAARKLSRFLAVDPLKEYDEWGTVVTTVDAAIAAMKRPTFRIIFQPDDDTDYESKQFKKDFQRLCKAVFLVGEMVYLVEELELFTRATWAPAAWRMITKRGRHKRIIVIAAAQRPADADSAFWSSCSYIRCHQLRLAKDRARMATELDVTYEEISKLKTIELSETKTQITYYERHFLKDFQGEKTITLTR